MKRPSFDAQQQRLREIKEKVNHSLQFDLPR